MACANGRGADQTFTITPADPNSGGGLTLHQGGIVDTPSGEWWGILMQDHGSIGRMVALVPITWENDFPLVGLPGNLRKAPNTWIKPDTGFTQPPKPPFVRNDDFNSPGLNPVWQWNHVPDDAKWSLAERPGVLRLHSLPATDFWTGAQQSHPAAAGARVDRDRRTGRIGSGAGRHRGLGASEFPLRLDRPRQGRGRRDPESVRSNRPQDHERPGQPHARLAARGLQLRHRKGGVQLEADGKEFAPLGDPFVMAFQLRTFQGVRLALFNFNTSGKPGGYADFDHFAVDEPRASGLERTIPLGKTVTLASGADGSLLAADTRNMLLINVAADESGAVPGNTRFQVIDLGKGRVALKAGNGRYVSAGADGVAFKDLAGTAPGDAESFQWVNLMRGDTMLMSLTSHRYLATKPNTPGPVTVAATGPRPTARAAPASNGRHSNSLDPRLTRGRCPRYISFIQKEKNVGSGHACRSCPRPPARRFGDPARRRTRFPHGHLDLSPPDARAADH